MQQKPNIRIKIIRFCGRGQKVLLKSDNTFYFHNFKGVEQEYNGEWE